MANDTTWHIGGVIAPPRFLAFLGVLAAGLTIGIPSLGLERATLIAFDVAAIVFLLLMTTLLRRGEADQMREAARRNDANRALLLGFTGLVMIVVLVAVANELKGKNDALAIALAVSTLMLTWLFSNTIYALHYAHLYYSDFDEAGKDAGGLDFPKCDEPDYWDFLYFAYTLGMTFQTSDVEISARHMRKVALGHCLAAFVFNLGVIAFTINLLGSSGGGGG